MKGLQRFISGMLAVCLLVSMLPVSAWATETEPVVETVPENTWHSDSTATEATENTIPVDEPINEAETEPIQTSEAEVLPDTTEESTAVQNTFPAESDTTDPATESNTYPSTEETSPEMLNAATRDGWGNSSDYVIEG